MPKFEFETTVTAPSEKDAIKKMSCLNILGSKLTLNELEVLSNTVSSPAALAIARQKLGL